MSSRLGTFVSALIGVLGLALASARGADAAKAAFTDEQLDQMLAPIALYPDSLLSQIFMACTYPADVASAAKWSKAHPDQKGDAAVKAVGTESWDPSVQSLVAFPQVLAMMDTKPDWVQQVGDAFLADAGRVMDRVQFLRKKAKDSGNLKSTEQQTVIVETPAPQETIIKIEPTQPQVVYVPTYNPTVVYGSWWWPAYPPVYMPPPPGYALASGIAAGIGFGVGIAVADSLWGGCNWGHGDVDINVNKYNNINVNNKLNANQNTWNHNSNNRKGVPYRDSQTQNKFGKTGVGGADSRQAFRGKEGTQAAAGGRDAQRTQATQALESRGVAAPARTPEQAVNRSREAEQGMRNNPQAGNQGAANRGGQGAGSRDSAFSGINSGGQTKQAASRGQASRPSASHSGGGGGGGGFSRGGGGGGGGGRGGGRR